jgi:hypothetical protein
MAKGIWEEQMQFGSDQLEKHKNIKSLSQFVGDDLPFLPASIH